MNNSNKTNKHPSIFRRIENRQMKIGWTVFFKNSQRIEWTFTFCDAGIT